MQSEATIEDVMTEGVVAVEQDKTIVEASNILEDEEIRGLVVVDQGDAVGVIVCRDIVYQVVAEGMDPRETTVDEVMSKDLIVAEEEELLDEVAMAMIRNNVSRIPVVRGDMVVGIVTQSDILRAWPGFAEVMEEKEELEASAMPDEMTMSGVCEDCENYSEDLVPTNGMALCSECRSSLDTS
ncbi:MAG: cyclic nucleotide-binding/CBS domain-containing protein [Candidatus Nanohaloarchaea archaeon]